MDCIPDRAFLASLRDAPACGWGTGGVAMLNPRLLSDIPSGWAYHLSEHLNVTGGVAMLNPRLLSDIPSGRAYHLSEHLNGQEFCESVSNDPISSPIDLADEAYLNIASGVSESKKHL
jgi:hypothetical protein